MELVRDAVVRPAVPEARGNGRLRVVPGPRADAGKALAERVPPVGADHEGAGPGLTATELRRDRALPGLDVRDRRVDPGNSGMPGNAARESGRQVGIGDVVAEGFGPDFSGAEQRFRRLEQAAGVVDQPQPGERRCLPVEPRPDAQMPKQLHAAAEKCRGALVRPGRFRPGEHHSQAGLGQRQRGDEPGGSSPDDEDALLNRGRRAPIAI